MDTRTCLLSWWPPVLPPQAQCICHCPRTPPQTKVCPPNFTKYYLTLLYFVGGHQNTSVVMTAAHIASGSTRYLLPPLYALSTSGMPTKFYEVSFMSILCCRWTPKLFCHHDGSSRSQREHCSCNRQYEGSGRHPGQHRYVHWNIILQVILWSMIILAVQRQVTEIMGGTVDGRYHGHSESALNMCKGYFRCVVIIDCKNMQFQYLFILLTQLGWYPAAPKC